MTEVVVLGQQIINKIKLSTKQKGVKNLYEIFVLYIINTIFIYNFFNVFSCSNSVIYSFHKNNSFYSNFCIIFYIFR